MRSRRGSRLAAFGIAYALAGCGGGAGNDAERLQLTFEQKPYVIELFDDTLAIPVCMKVTVQPVPSAVPTVRIADSGATYVPGALDFFGLGGATFMACPSFQPSLAAGTHTGTLTVTICKDPGCAQPYSLSDPSLPYSVTVWHVVPGLPPLTATLKIDAVVTADVNEGLQNDVRTYAVSLVSGQTIEVDPSEPFVLIEVDNHGTAARLTSVSHPLPGSVLATATLPDGFTSGTVDLIGRSQDGRTIKVSIAVTR
ncbi:MAG TPA: hypothetical protein VIV57_12230 [Anaeromyxobacter sp.]